MAGVHEVVDAHRPLRGSGTPAEERFDRFPADFTIKGMFFQRLVPLVDASALEGLPIRVPPGRRYLSFKSYAQVYYSRLAHLAATTQYPRVDTREAMRQLARQDFAQFSSSTVAKVTLSFVGGCADALMRLPELYRISMDGGRVESERRPDGVRLHFDEFYGWLDCYPVGTVEGLCMHYGLTPRIVLDLEDDVRGRFDVTWTEPTSP